MYKKSNFIISVLSILLLTLSAFTQAAQVKDIRVTQQVGVTRLIFELDGSAEHKMFSLTSPERVVLDINKSQISRDVINNLTALSSDTLMRVRYAMRNTGVRFVLDLNKKSRSKSSFLAASGEFGPRIMVELEYGAQPTGAVNTATATATAVKSIASISSEKRDVVVVIDPGHGGKDPGALGKHKVREKDVVLSIGRELANRLNAIEGVKAIMTRSSDEFLQLRDRSRIAREANADLMISIHADAFTKPSARGASVWALSLSGKTSEMGRWLAEQEQAADLVGGISLDDKDQLLAEVLLDMSMNSTIQMSLDVGGKVLREMKGVAVLHKSSVQQAGFVVLKSPDIPSILIETGFVSNDTEAKNLASATYRQQLASSIAKGVQDYFFSNPPDGTYIAWRKNQRSGGSSVAVSSTKTPTVSAKAATTPTKASAASVQTASSVRIYKVSKGDTLSDIARKNGVSLESLRAANTLKNDVIWVGQKLSIPAG